MVLGVGYRKQCKEKAVQCLSRLNISLGAGTGRLQKWWGGRLSSAVALAAAMLHAPAQAGLLLQTLPGSPTAWLGIPSHPHPCLGEFLAGPHCVSQHHSSLCVGQDVPTAVPEAPPALHQGSGRSLVLPFARTTSGASASLNPACSGSSPITQAQPHILFPPCPLLLTPRRCSLGALSHGYL